MLSYIVAICISQIISTHAASGKATFYGGNPSGNACGFNGVATSSFPNGYYAATGGANFNDGYGCGKCFRVTCVGPYGNNPDCSCSTSTPSVIVQSLDQCPECTTSHFDLNPTAMELICAPGLAGTCGVIEITYERVSCDYDVNFRVRNKEGTNKWWYGLHLDNLAGPGNAERVELFNRDGTGIGDCNKGEGVSFWICNAWNGEFPDPPWSIKLTADDGSQVTATDCITSLAGGAEMQCNVNFGGGGGGGTTTTTTTTTATTSTTRTTNGGGGNSGTTITITNKPGLNQWWYAVTVTSSNAAVSVESISVKARNMAGYERGVAEWDYFKFTGNTPYVPPFTFNVELKRAKTISEVNQENVIESLEENDSGTITVSSAYLAEEENKGGLGWAVFAICIIILIVIGIIILSVYCIMKKRRSKVEVGFDEKYGDDDEVIKEEEVNTNDIDDEQEIEVDVQLTTAP